jgi:hypothetical protein
MMHISFSEHKDKSELCSLTNRQHFFFLHEEFWIKCFLHEILSTMSECIKVEQITEWFQKQRLRNFSKLHYKVLVQKVNLRFSLNIDTMMNFNGDRFPVV